MCQIFGAYLFLYSIHYNLLGKYFFNQTNCSRAIYKYTYILPYHDTHYPSTSSYRHLYLTTHRTPLHVAIIQLKRKTTKILCLLCYHHSSPKRPYVCSSWPTRRPPDYFLSLFPLTPTLYLLRVDQPQVSSPLTLPGIYQ